MLIAFKSIKRNFVASAGLHQGTFVSGNYHSILLEINALSCKGIEIWQQRRRTRGATDTVSWWWSSTATLLFSTWTFPLVDRDRKHSECVAFYELHYLNFPTPSTTTKCKKSNLPTKWGRFIKELWFVVVLQSGLSHALHLASTSLQLVKLVCWSVSRSILTQDN